MIDEFNENSKYNDMFNRIQKEFSFADIFFLSVKDFFTNNKFYYVLCVIFRFNPLVLISVYYPDLTDKYYNSKLIRKILGTLTLYNIIEYIHLSYRLYITINILIYISFFIRLIIYVILISKFNNYKNKHQWPIPNKYRIISDHVVFLFFPYIIEYLSFAYYIYFFPDKYMIQFNDDNKLLLITIMIVNTILIIYYNLINSMYMSFINKIYTTSIYDVILRDKNKKIKKNHNTISYRCSNLSFSIYIILQNLTLVLKIEKYIIKYKFRVIFKTILIIIILILLIILFFNKMYEYDYTNFINKFINLIIIFCIYSITFEFFLKLIKYSIPNNLYEIIFILMKVLLSYNSYILYCSGNKQYFKLKMIDILFLQKKNEKEKTIINTFYYLNEIMTKIKENNDIIIIKKLLEYFNKHIKKCNKQTCNCQLFKFLIQQNDLDNNKEELKTFINELLIILNYIYELAFFDYDYWNKFELIILLSEHFCHLKDNPIIAFSIINTFYQKQKNNLSTNETIIVYELSQKYIYYISAGIKKEINKDIYNDNKKLLIINEKNNYYNNYFNNLILSYKIKKIIIDYIDILIKIIKYKVTFEDSLSISIDENDKDNIFIEMNFFHENYTIDNINNKKDKNTVNNLNSKKNNNAYYIINLLKKEYKLNRDLIHSFSKFELVKDIPIFIIYKSFLFFDIIKGGKMNSNEANLFKRLLENKINLINNYVSEKEYKILKKIYHSQNSKYESKYFIIFEFKNDLIIKYFSEECSLKLGYEQKDIIKKTIDCLMPSQFYESHEQLIKQELIVNQLKYIHYDKHFLFDINSTRMYPIKFEAKLIYNLYKNLIIISKCVFINEHEYTFMLNNNFELLSNSKNFEDEYFINQEILKIFNIKIIDILKINPNEIVKKFNNIFKKINFQKSIRDYKTEEYIIPKLYTQSVLMDPKIRISNDSKNSSILFKILKFYHEEQNLFDGAYEKEQNENDEFKKLINKEKVKNILYEVIMNPLKVIFHDKYTETINKKQFIENLFIELSKVSTNENDNYHNIMIKAKTLIEKLLLTNELSNNFIRMTIKLSYYFNKQFYFIIINDDKKTNLKILKYFNLDSYEKKENISNSISLSSLETTEALRNSIKSKNTKFLKNENINIINEEKNLIDINNKNVKTNLNINKKVILNINKRNEHNYIIKKINNSRDKINNDIFVLIIRLILLIIIICIIIMYIIILNLKKNITNKIEKIIMANYYNYQTRDIMLDIHSRLLEIYYEFNSISVDSLNDLKEQQNILISFANKLKDIYHNFTDYFSEYNLIFNNNINSIYNIKKFWKIFGFWEEVEYKSRYIEEINVIIYNIYSIDLVNKTNEIIEDSNNFLFFNNKNNYNNKKIQTTYIKMLFYFCINYELVYNKIFNEINIEIDNSFKKYRNNKIIIYYLLEIIALVCYIIFFIVVIIFLYDSNKVIIQNILFLFLDFSEEEFNYNKKKNNENNNLIIFKLIEFKKIIIDFDLNRFKAYKIKINNINPKRIKKNEHKNKQKKNKNQKKNEKEIEINTRPNNAINNQTKYNSSLNFDGSNKKILKKEKNKKIENNKDLINNNIYFGLENKTLNNSSFNNLMNSFHILKNNINNNSIEAINKLQDNDNNKNDIKNTIFKYNKNSILKNNKSEENNPILNKILNQSYYSIGILRIKIISFIVLIVFLIVIIYSLIKIKYLFSFVQGLKYFFNDYRIISDRFSLLIYYLNIFKTLIIFHDDNTKYNMSKILDNINMDFEQENNEYKVFLLYHIKNYKITQNLLNNLTYTGENSTDIINETICSQEQECINYINSKYNIFDAGFYFSYKSCFSYLSNFYEDYKSIKNKTDIEEIKSKIIKSNYSLFNSLSLGVSNLVYYAKNSVHQCFLDDQTIFLNNHNKILSILTILSVIFSIILIFFINIFVFISISSFSIPIKDSAYRINCSLYYIKKYKP